MTQLIDSDSDLISILMPVKNAAPWLEDCLNSILKQTHQNWELLAVDDGSSDASIELLKRYSILDARIKWSRNKGKGIIDALDVAYHNCNGKFIHRMDADDVMPKDKLEVLKSLLHQHPTAIATGKVQYFGRNPISAGYKKYEEWINARCDQNDHLEWMYRECVIASPNWLVHRKNIDAIVGFKNLSYPEDYDLVLKWFSLGYRVVPTEKITHYWRDHDARTSRNSPVYDQDSFFKLKLNHWLKNNYKKDCTTVVVGENNKAQKTMKILTAHDVKYRWLGIQGKATEHFSVLASIASPQVLVAVYPPEPQFSTIKNHLDDLNLRHGQDYWWL